MVPNEWELLKKDWESFGKAIAGIPANIWMVVKAIVDIPNRIVDHLEHAALK